MYACTSQSLKNGTCTAPSLSDLLMSRKSSETTPTFFPRPPHSGTRAARIVERIGDRAARRRFADAREQQAQHGMDVGHRADGGMRSAAEPLLVDDHRHREVFDRVGVGLRVFGQEVADEQREVLVELALGLRRQRVEHDRRFPRARYAGEDRELALGNLERDVFEVVFARAADGDELGHGVS